MAQNITSIIELLASQEQGLTPDAGPNEKKTGQISYRS